MLDIIFLLHFSYQDRQNHPEFWSQGFDSLICPHKIDGIHKNDSQVRRSKKKKNWISLLNISSFLKGNKHILSLIIKS
jgi:hypothetical protein